MLSESFDDITLRDRLVNDQAVILRSGSHPLLRQSICEIQALVDSSQLLQAYEHVVKGDTDEAHEVEVLRLIKDKRQYVNQPAEVFSAAKRLEFEMFSDSMKTLYQTVAPAAQQINRMQINVLKAGGFIGEHRDNDEINQYELVAILNLSTNYQGGLYCVTPPHREALNFDASFGDLILTTATVNHHVTRVTQGERKTLVCFLGR